MAPSIRLKLSFLPTVLIAFIIPCSVKITEAFIFIHLFNNECKALFQRLHSNIEDVAFVLSKIKQTYAFYNSMK